MSYEFTRLSAVEAIDAIGDTAKILVEEDGVIKKAPKDSAVDFQKLSNVEEVTEPSESANVLIEENGIIKKTPKTAVGGSGGGFDAIVTINSDYQSYFNVPTSAVSLTQEGFSAIREKLLSGDAPNVRVLYNYTYGSTFIYAYSPIKVWTDGYCGVRMTIADYDTSKNTANIRALQINFNSDGVCESCEPFYATGTSSF